MVLVQQPRSVCCCMVKVELWAVKAFAPLLLSDGLQGVNPWLLRAVGVSSCQLGPAAPGSGQQRGGQLKCCLVLSQASPSPPVTGLESWGLASARGAQKLPSPWAGGLNAAGTGVSEAGHVVPCEG